MTSAENALFVNLLVHELRYSTLAQRSKGNFYGKAVWYIYIYIYIYIFTYIYVIYIYIYIIKTD